MRRTLIVGAALIATLLVARFGTVGADTCSDACDKTYASCNKSCKESNTDCFTKCINEHNSCLSRCP
jgi:hypothetical protein